MDDAFTFDDHEQAKEAAAILVNNGFAAQAHDESSVQKYFLMSEPVGAAKVDVESAQLKDAREFVAKRAAAGDQILSHAWRCPDCGGFEVQYPQFSRKSVIPAISMDLLAAGKVVEKKCYCQECKATWAPGESKPSHERVESETHHWGDASKES